MAEGNGSTGVVAVLVIFIIVVVLGFFAWQSGMLGGKSEGDSFNLELNAPAPSLPSPSDNNGGK